MKFSYQPRYITWTRWLLASRELLLLQLAPRLRGLIVVELQARGETIAASSGFEQARQEGETLASEPLALVATSGTTVSAITTTIVAGDDHLVAGLGGSLLLDHHRTCSLGPGRDAHRGAGSPGVAAV